MRPIRVPNPFQTCPDCGAPARQPHHESCRWSYPNMRSKLPATTEAQMQDETPEQPIPLEEPEPDTETEQGDGNGDDDAEGEE